MIADMEQLEQRAVARGDWPMALAWHQASERLRQAVPPADAATEVRDD